MNTLPQQLREQARWLESRSVVELHGDLERVAADEIERLRAIVDPINELRKEEGDLLVIGGERPKFTESRMRNTVVVCGNWSKSPQSFHGDTLAEALANAVAARAVAKKES